MDSEIESGEGTIWTLLPVAKALKKVTRREFLGREVAGGGVKSKDCEYRGEARARQCDSSNGAELEEESGPEPDKGRLKTKSGEGQG